MSFVADIFTGVVNTVASVVEDIVTLDVEGLVDTAVSVIEGVVHTITHPTEDPIATIMLAIAAYGVYTSATAEAAVAATAKEASAAAIAKAKAAGMTAAQAKAAGAAAAKAVAQSAAGISTAAGATGTGAVSGPMFEAAVLGSEVGISMAAGSTSLAAAGVVTTSGLGAMDTSPWAATREGALRGASAVTDVTMAGPSLSLAPGAYGGVGAGSAAGSMIGWGGGGGITAVSTGNLFLNALKSVWTDTYFAAPEDIDFATDYEPSEAAWGDQFVEGLKKPFQKVQQFGEDFYKEIEEIGQDPWVKAEEYGGKVYDDLLEKSQERYPFLDPEFKFAIPTSTDELIELGVDAMAESFANWSPTISYQAGGDPGSATSESYPSFTRAETGILGDPFNLEGQDLALTASGLASQLQQQRGLPFGQQEMGMAPTFYDPTAFRQRQAPAEELKQLMDPSYAVNQYQQPMVNEMINQLNANAQVRGLAPSAEGVSRGVAPLLSKLRQDNLSALNRAAGLDLEATGGAMGQRAGDITAQQQYQDIGVGADVARKNITLNSLLALAQMSKPTIIGGTTQRGSSQAATPGTVFSGKVPVGNILSTGWNWLTNDNSNPNIFADTPDMQWG